MKKNLLLVVLIILSLNGLAQDFKVIGYLPYYRFGFADQIAFEKLTHLRFKYAQCEK